MDIETKPGHFAKFDAICNKGIKKAAIFTHPYPDPDAIGSIMGLQWLLTKKYNVESDSFYSGKISHPQNKAVVNLLDPGLKPVSECNKDNYDCFMLVDTIPSHAGTMEGVKFDLVIDHHKEAPNGGFNGLFINLKAGSCCGQIFDIIKHANLVFEDGNDYDARVATSLLVGIITDSDYQMAEETTSYEFDAYHYLFPFRDGEALKKIINFERPRFWVDAKADATKRAVIEEGVGVVGMGIIPERHRDVIADMSQEMLTWEEVNTAVVFALVEGARIEGSVRSSSASMSVPDLCKELGGIHGTGGGKLGKGAYRYELGGGVLEEEDDDDVKKEFWDTLNHKEQKRILRSIKKC